MRQRCETHGDTYCSTLFGDGALPEQDVVKSTAHPGLAQLRVVHRDTNLGHRRGDELLSEFLPFQSPTQGQTTVKTLYPCLTYCSRLKLKGSILNSESFLKRTFEDSLVSLHFHCTMSVVPVEYLNIHKRNVYGPVLKCCLNTLTTQMM